MIKKAAIILTMLIATLMPSLALSGSVAAVQAIPACNDTAKNTDVCHDYNGQAGNNGKNNPIVGIIKSALQVLTYIIGSLAIILMVVSGIRLMTSGDANAAASARSALLYSLIGIAVAALAEVIVAFVLDNVK